MKFRLIQSVLWGCLALALISCGPATENTVTTHEPPAPNASTPLVDNTPRKPLDVKIESGLTDDEKKKLDSTDKAELLTMEKEQQAAKAAYVKSKEDEDKKKYIAQNLKLAKAMMESPALEPREKYRPALKLYREVLSVDPKNEEAKRWVATIEGIYKQMGMTVPR